MPTQPAFNPIRQGTIAFLAALTLAVLQPTTLTAEVPMGILKGTLIAEPAGTPLDRARLRLIGSDAATLTNEQGLFLLEAPARTYAGLVLELPETGAIALIEQEIRIESGRILDLELLEMETLNEPLDENLPIQPKTIPQPPSLEDLEIPRTNPTLNPNPDLDPTLDRPDDRAPFPPVQPDPRTREFVNELPPLLLEARALAARGNFTAADRAYEEHLSLFPRDGRTMVEHGVMVFHNIQQAKGRSILRRAANLPGLGPMEMAAIDSHLPPPAAVIHTAPKKTPHVHIRFRNRKKAH